MNLTRASTINVVFAMSRELRMPYEPTNIIVARPVLWLIEGTNITRESGI